MFICISIKKDINDCRCACSMWFFFYTPQGLVAWHDKVQTSLPCGRRALGIGLFLLDGSEIRRENHLGCKKNPVNNGINIHKLPTSTGFVGFLPPTSMTISYNFSPSRCFMPFIGEICGLLYVLRWNALHWFSEARYHSDASCIE